MLPKARDPWQKNSHLQIHMPRLKAYWAPMAYIRGVKIFVFSFFRFLKGKFNFATSLMCILKSNGLICTSCINLYVYNIFIIIMYNTAKCDLS